MNLLEAIQGAGENWFRPVEWRGIAFSCDEFEFISFEGDKRQEYGRFTSDAKIISGEWEIVTPEQVLAERKS